MIFAFNNETENLCPNWQIVRKCRIRRMSTEHTLRGKTENWTHFAFRRNTYPYQLAKYQKFPHYTHVYRAYPSRKDQKSSIFFIPLGIFYFQFTKKVFSKEYFHETNRSVLVEILKFSRGHGDKSDILRFFPQKNTIFSKIYSSINANNSVLVSKNERSG